jgi:hypothetical protein
MLVGFCGLPVVVPNTSASGFAPEPALSAAREDRGRHDLDLEVQELVGHDGEHYGLDASRAEREQEAPMSSLEADMKAHPEKYQGGIYVKARPGHFQLFFLRRKPSGTEDDSGSKPPTDDK